MSSVDAALNEGRSERVDHPVLPPGSQVRLGLPGSEGNLQWLPTHVDDHQADHSVVVDWPLHRRDFVPLQIGQSVVLAAARDGGLLTAEMLVETLSLSDPPQVLLRPDGPWQRTQRRQDVRLPVLIKPRIAERVALAEREPVDVVIRNLSAGGVLLVRATQPLELGQQIELRLDLGQQPDLEACVEVMRIEMLARGEFRLWEAGCRFIDLPADDLDRIVRFIFEQERQRARRQPEAGG